MTQEFGSSRTQISGATSIGAILGTAVAPFTGQLVDRIGSRVLLAAGCMVVGLAPDRDRGLACLYLSAAHTLVGFYLAFSLSRMADQGAIKIAASPAVGKWFPRYRGRAIALVFSAASAGIIVWPPTGIGGWPRWFNWSSTPGVGGPPGWCGGSWPNKSPSG